MRDTTDGDQPLPPQPPAAPSATPTRRVLILGVAASGLLVGCGSAEESAAGPAGGAGTTGAAGGGGGAAGGSGGGRGAAGTAVAKVADVPVGGGVVVEAQGVVVTQPEQGTFKGFTNICTHQQCPVARVAGRQIQCDCHGSRFSIEDGQPTPDSPAKSALAEKPVAVRGDSIMLA